MQFMACTIKPECFLAHESCTSTKTFDNVINRICKKNPATTTSFVLKKMLILLFCIKCHANNYSKQSNDRCNIINIQSFSITVI